jgi:hypothetical protein
MKLFSGLRYAAIFAFFLLLAAPAFAQFEVSPDHFDENAPAPRKAVSANGHQVHINSTKGTAVAKTSQNVASRAVRVDRAGKPSPGTKSATVVTAATADMHRSQRRQTSARGSSSAKPNRAEPKLKAQASPGHRE